MDYSEWFNQADYDMDTAEYMAMGGRFFYAVFMCHLSLEKALKGLFQKRTALIPEKSHNLIYFLNKLETKPPDELARFIAAINEANITTRYPDNLSSLRDAYTKEKTDHIIEKSKEVLEWIKRQL